MEPVSSKRIWVVMILLLLTSTAVWYLHSQNRTMVFHSTLAHSITIGNPWRAERPYHLENNIISALALDDYLYLPYRNLNDSSTVGLYVGFYHSAVKIGAAHDPLVCFQGQGWVVGQRKTGTLSLQGESGLQINYSSLIADNGLQKELVVYWFQSLDRTANSTASQKSYMFVNKLLGRGGANAFVRFTTSLNDVTEKAGFQHVEELIRMFYPQFLHYITQNPGPG